MKLPQERSERIESDPLAKAIVSMMNAMKADFGPIFTKAFSTEEETTQYKRRLYKKLKGISLNAIIDGYESLVDKGTKFCPTVPEILEAVVRAEKEHKKAQINRIEAERVSALPPPTITCDPVQMFADAKAKQTGRPTRAEMDSMIENHRALLILHGNNIKSIRPNGDQICKYGACNKAGTLSGSTSGGGNFYCIEHFRMAL